MIKPGNLPWADTLGVETPVSISAVRSMSSANRLIDAEVSDAKGTA